jgi:hypothetical protein
LSERREAGFPPYAHQVLLRAEAGQREAVDRFLGRAAQEAASWACRRGLRASAGDGCPRCRPRAWAPAGAVRRAANCNASWMPGNRICPVLTPATYAGRWMSTPGICSLGCGCDRARGCFASAADRHTDVARCRDRPAIIRAPCNFTRP